MHDGFHWKCYTPEIHQIQKLKFHSTISNLSQKISESVLRDTKESEFPDVVSFGDVAFSLDSVLS